MRTYYALRSLVKLKGAALRPGSPRDYWQAGKSVGEIHAVRSVADVYEEFREGLRAKGYEL